MRAKDDDVPRLQRPCGGRMQDRDDDGALLSGNCSDRVAIVTGSDWDTVVVSGGGSPDGSSEVRSMIIGCSWFSGDDVRST